MKVKLKGKSNKGKSRVGSFGSAWEVLRQESKVMFGQDGVWLLIRPEEKPNADLRWVNKDSDKDFIVENVQ